MVSGNTMFQMSLVWITWALPVEIAVCSLNFFLLSLFLNHGSWEI